MAWPLYTLRADKIVPLNLPNRQQFDASGLVLTPQGELLTVSDRGATLYRIEFQTGGSAANLVAVPQCFTARQLAPWVEEKRGRYDCEGIAQDDQGRFYLCEEANRWILRCDPKAEKAERLAIDWSPVKDYFSTDPNASFEGIAIGGQRLYVANERSTPVIIVVDLASLKVVDDFIVWPKTSSLLGLCYSDLSWYDGKLWVLCRQHGVVLEVDPLTHAVLAEFDYQRLEDQLGYKKPLPVGMMEGLAVDCDFLWLVIDNNGSPHTAHPKDIRPTLLKCPRPDK
jgi:hypothetical protein